MSLPSNRTKRDNHMSVVHRLLLLASLVLVVGAVAALAATLRPGKSISPRENAQSTGTLYDSTTDAYIESLQIKLQRRPDDAEALAQLGLADLQKARETGDPAYYSKAEEAIGKSLSLDPNNPDGLRGLALVALARHDFEGGLALANKAIDLDQSSASTYGVIGDALIELGRYDEAVDAYQRMLDLKPDLSAYARTSHARELYGDIDGAREAMQLAIDSGGSRGESLAWAHLQLGNLYYNYGDPDSAQTQYDASLAAFPGYVHGSAALAKVKAAEGDTSGAIALYRQVVDRYPVLEYVVALGDLYRTHGDDAAANKQYELVGVIDQLLRTNGVNSDLELALYYADHDLHLDDALRQARAEYDRRPSVQAADTLAWTLYKTGSYQEALGYSDEAMRLGSRDPLYAFHAGMIRDKLGDSLSAASLLSQALDTNPHFSVLHAAVAEDTLQQLELVQRQQP